MLILLMQFLWKYIDDLIGKGLDFIIVLELLFYSTITLIPIALPLSVLLASMMLVGGLAERSEITAINSLGQPYIYILKPLLICSIIIGATSFLISNYSIPYANLKATTLMYDIMKKKLSINIKEKVFFSDIEGYSIRIEKKDQNGLMEDIIIYDYSEKKGVNRIFIANNANISINEINNELNIQLFDGEIFNEKKENRHSYILKTRFDQYNLNLDLTSFRMERSEANRFNNKAKALNIKKLKIGLDSLDIQQKKYMHEILYKLQIDIDERYTDNKTILKHKKKLQINDLKKIERKMNFNTLKINKFSVELQRKYTLAVACIIMLIIGSSFGAIIQKSGFGLPVIFSIILFLLYHIISITGEKMVKKNVLDPTIGMWGSTIIMIIIGILLVIIANNKKINQLK